MLHMKFNCFVAGKSSNVGKDGNTYYNLALVSDGQAGNVSCPKSVFEAVPVMQEVTFSAVYDLRWNSFRIISVVPNK